MYKKTTLIAFNTIVIKEITRFTRIWMQTILPPTIGMALYFIIFGIPTSLAYDFGLFVADEPIITRCILCSY